MAFADDLTGMLHALTAYGALYAAPEYRVENSLPAERFPVPYYPPERHPGHVELIRLLSGGAGVLINGGWTELTDGRPLVFLRDAWHTEHHLGASRAYELLWLTVAPDGLNSHYTGYAPKNGYYQSALRVHIASPFAAELWASANGGIAEAPRFHALLIESLDYAVKHGVLDGSNYHRDVARQVKHYLDRCFFRPITLDELGALTHYSVPHLNLLFRRAFGLPMRGYLEKVRLDNARKLLASGCPVGAAAARSGFRDQRYFSRLFKKRFARTPTEYAAGCLLR